MSEPTLESEERQADRRLLVPIADTVTARDAVDYAVAQAGEGAIHLVVATGESHEGPREGETRAAQLLNRARAWAVEDARDVDLAIETAVIGEEEFLFAPADYARLFAEYVETHDLDAIILDPEYWYDTTAPLVESFTADLRERDIACEYPSTPRPARHERIAGRVNWNKILTVFVISFGFYVVLGDPFYWFDLVTGVAVAAIVAISFAQVTYGRSPRYPGSILRTIRFGIYIPYLVYEIVKANVIIALVILRPSMPIDPRMTRIRVRVDSGLPTLALANSITLTPGTLTVRAESHELIVHTLVPAAREDLFGGRLERAIRFVFYGRDAAAIPSPKERGEADVLDGGEDR